MNCSKCGADLFDGAKFCAVCGARAEQEEPMATDVSAAAPIASVIPESSPVISAIPEAAPVTSVIPEAAPVTSVIPEPAPVLPMESISTPVDIPQAEPVAVAPSEFVVGAAPVTESVDVAAPATAEATPKKDKTKKSGKKLLIAILAGLALIVIGVAIFFGAQALSGLFGGSSQIKPYLIVSAQDESYVYSGANDPAKIDGSSDWQTTSFDGKTIGFAMETDDDGFFELVVFNGKDTMTVEDEVYDFKISDNGSKVIYLADVDTDDATGTLYSYDVSSQKSEEIADGVTTQVGIALSPDGKSIGYSADVKTDDFGYTESFMGYVVKDGGEAVELGENMSPVVISDKATYIYYLEIDLEDSDTTLFVSKNDNEVKLDKLEDDNTFYFNKDYSELLYVNDGSTYRSIGGADAEKVSSDAITSILLPRQTNASYEYDSSYVMRLDVASLKDRAVTINSDGDTVVGYMNASYEVSEIESLDSDYYYYSIQVSKDDKSLCFLNDKGDLLIYSNYRDLKAEPVKIAADEDIIDVYAVSDFKTIYVIDEEGTLYAVYNSQQPVEVAEDVDSLTFSFDEARVFFTSDADTKEDYITVGTLNVMDNKSGAKPEELEEDVYWMQSSAFGVVYYVFEEVDEETYETICEAFYSRDGKTFESVTDEATLW